jgi:hypothetical protein
MMPESGEGGGGEGNWRLEGGRREGKGMEEGGTEKKRGGGREDERESRREALTMALSQAWWPSRLTVLRGVTQSIHSEP